MTNAFILTGMKALSAAASAAGTGCSSVRGMVSHRSSYEKQFQLALKGSLEHGTNNRGNRIRGREASTKEKTTMAGKQEPTVDVGIDEGQPSVCMMIEKGENNVDQPFREQRAASACEHLQL